MAEEKESALMQEVKTFVDKINELQENMPEELKSMGVILFVGETEKGGNQGNVTAFVRGNEFDIVNAIAEHLDEDVRRILFLALTMNNLSNKPKK